jgi:hypothetical protein
MTWRQRNTHNCRPREGGEPVRRGLSLSVQSLPSLEYWIPAFAGMTTEHDATISRHDLPELCYEFPALQT